MAVRRFNSNVGDFITCAVGGCSTFHEGAFTVAALVRKEADGGFFPMISAEVGASSRRSLWTTGADQLMSNTGGTNVNTPVSFTQADGWAVVVVTKAAGTVATRGHKGILGGSWTHADGDQGFDDSPGTQILTNIKIGTWQDNAHWHGLIAVVAMWAGTALSDAALEVGFTTSAAAWLDAAPSGMWLLNQESTGTAVVDVTGDGADQTAIDGTSVELADDPPGFDFGGVAVAASGIAYGTVLGESIASKNGAGFAAALTTSYAQAVTTRTAAGEAHGEGDAFGHATATKAANSGTAGHGASYATGRPGKLNRTGCAGVGGCAAQALAAGKRFTTAAAFAGGFGRGVNTRSLTTAAVGHGSVYGAHHPVVSSVPIRGPITTRSTTRAVLARSTTAGVNVR